jgi:DNA-binding CsgD family transcriptional regulator
MVFMGATFAAVRLQNIAELSARRLGTGPSLTPRELAVLRMLSLGRRTRETAELLELSEETVRSHLKKAIGKLGVRNSIQAVAQALRLRLIP